MVKQDHQHLFELLQLLRSNDVFNTLNPDLLAELEPELEIIGLPKGTVLFQGGDPGDAMFFITRGMLEVSAPQLERPALLLDRLDSGSIVGETALLTGRPRSANVSAVVDSEVVRLSKSGFERLSQMYPDLAESLSTTILPRIQRSQLAAALTGLFGPLEIQAMHSIQRNVTWRHLSSGEILVRKGDPGEAMFIVINGRLRIVDDASAEPDRILGDVTRGETVGEFALLTAEPRSATVFAVRDTDVVSLTGAYLDELMEAFPRMVLQMTRSIARRSQAQLARRRSSPATTTVLAVIPSEPWLPFKAFIAKLAAELATIGRTTCLDSQRFDEQFGRRGAAQLPAGHPTSTVINSWLTEIEQGSQYLILAGDPEMSEWTRRCLRQADRVVLVTRANDGNDPDLFFPRQDPALPAPAIQSAPDLVLIQPEGAARPANTAGWLSRLRPRTHHHVRMSVKGDFSRLARRLTGRGVGLVLSGGGARGFAHAGAIRALEEAGQEIDLIGGTSMGALLGGLYAMDRNYEAILDLARKFSSSRKLLDYTLPFTSLAASYKVTRVLKEFFSDVKIEDLWRNFFCVSSNLTQGEPVIHEAGSLWEAVRASISIPGIFVPVLRAGEVLVDGGVMNNFPADIMRKRNEGGFVIGVNASPKKEIAGGFAFGPAISAWDLLWSKINPLAPKIRAPSVLSNLIRATEASSAYRNSLNLAEADLLITPSVEAYSTLAFDDYQAIIEAGYQDARHKLAELAK